MKTPCPNDLNENSSQKNNEIVDDIKNVSSNYNSANKTDKNTSNNQSNISYEVDKYILEENTVLNESFEIFNTFMDNKNDPSSILERIYQITNGHSVANAYYNKDLYIFGIQSTNGIIRSDENIKLFYDNRTLFQGSTGFLISDKRIIFITNGVFSVPCFEIETILLYLFNNEPLWEIQTNNGRFYLPSVSSDRELMSSILAYICSNVLIYKNVKIQII